MNDGFAEPWPMSDSGRLPKITNDRIVEAKPEKSWLRVGPLWRNPTDRFGSRPELHLSKFVAVKLPLEFRFPEAAIRDRVQTTPSGRLPKITNDRIVEAKPEKSWLRVGPLWRNPTGGFGSKG